MGPPKGVAPEVLTPCSGAQPCVVRACRKPEPNEAKRAAYPRAIARSMCKRGWAFFDEKTRRLKQDNFANTPNFYTQLNLWQDQIQDFGKNNRIPSRSSIT